MTEEGRHALFHHVVFWHGLRLLPQLRNMPEGKLHAVLAEAGEINHSDALFFHPKKDILLASLPNLRLSGGEVAAICVFGLWVASGERREMCTTLIKEWPEIDMVLGILNDER